MALTEETIKKNATSASFRKGKSLLKDGGVEELLVDLEGLFDDMKSQMLPQSREEFEARAILFYILMQMKTLLQIKRDFVLENVRG